MSARSTSSSSSAPLASTSTASNHARAASTRARLTRARARAPRGRGVALALQLGDVRAQAAHVVASGARRARPPSAATAASAPPSAAAPASAFTHVASTATQPISMKSIHSTRNACGTTLYVSALTAGHSRQLLRSDGQLVARTCDSAARHDEPFIASSSTQYTELR